MVCNECLHAMPIDQWRLWEQVFIIEREREGEITDHKRFLV